MKNNHYTLYNKVDLLPFFSNHIGIDKLIVELPRKEYRSNLLIKSTKIEVDCYTGELLNQGEISEGIYLKEYSNSIRLVINPSNYFYGNNFVTVGYNHFKLLVKKIYEEFNLNIENGIIRRIDFQCTLKMNYIPESYFNMLGGYKNFNRNIVSSSLYYNSKASSKYKTGLFYDKGKKDKKKKSTVLSEGYYLRIEWQYFNNLIKNQIKKFKRTVMLIKDLLNRRVYELFIKLWYLDCNSIRMEQSRIINMNLIFKPTDIDKMLINQGLEYIGGMQEFEKMMDNSKHIINKPSYFISKIKKRVRDISKNTNFTIENPQISELNTKIDFAYQNTLNSLQN